MSKRNIGGNDIRPGQCDPVYGAPPPTEIVCIQVDKIYDECKNIQVNEVLFIEDGIYAVTDASCLDVELISVNCSSVNNGRVKVSFSYKVRVLLTFANNETEERSQVFSEEKTFFLTRAGEQGLDEKCEIYFECLECFVEDVIDPYMDNNNMVRSRIICCIGKLILVKLFAHVQLMVPAYGFCPQPPECEEVLAICPDFDPEWPPYPPQD